MTPQRKSRLFHLIGLLAAAAMVFAACAAPAAAPAAPAGEAPAEAPAASSELPAEPGRGTDGTLNLLYWQAVSLLNPYQSTGTKDFHAASLIVEPLVEYDPDGNVLPVLVTEVPTVENGGVSADLTTITYNLLPDVVWSDGTPFTAADVIFTYEYCTNPDTGCSSAQAYAGVTSVEAVDDLTVLLTFDAPKAFPYTAFGSQLSPILQAAQFADCVGAAAKECAANSAVIGTGPYMVKEFKANDVVVYEVNPNYRKENQPHFAEIVMKGGGDAPSAASAALETGEVDYAWNLQVEPAILNGMAAGGKGTLVSAFAGNVERILINHTNPDPALGDKRSEWTMEDPNPHPFLTDPVVLSALSMAIDRGVINEQLYGAAGTATCNILAGPPAVASTANDGCLVQDIEGANAALEAAGWVDSNGDGSRDKDGVELKILYQTSTNAVRQKAQALIQQWWGEIGVVTELKNIDAGVFFGPSDNADSLGRFYADVQMFTNGPETTDPENYLAGWRCGENGENIANLASNYLGNNTERWCSPEYDAMFAELQATVDPAARAALAAELNDMLVQNYVMIPLIFRASVSAHSNTLGGVLINGWDTELWNTEDWYRVR